MSFVLWTPLVVEWPLVVTVVAADVVDGDMVAVRTATRTIVDQGRKVRKDIVKERHCCFMILIYYAYWMLEMELHEPLNIVGYGSGDLILASETVHDLLLEKVVFISKTSLGTCPKLPLRCAAIGALHPVSSLARE